MSAVPPVRWVRLVDLAAAVAEPKNSLLVRAQRSNWTSVYVPRPGNRSDRAVRLDELPEDWRDRAAEKAFILAAGEVSKAQLVDAWRSYLKRHPELAKRAATDAFCCEWNAIHTSPHASWSNLHRWATTPAKTEAKPRVAKEAEWPAGLLELFKALWLDQSRPRKATAYREAISRLKLEPNVCPSTRTAQRVAKTFSADETVYMREGKKAYADKIANCVWRDWTLIRSNDVWFGDHHTFDFMIAHPETGKAVRPWLTAWMDGRSRKFVGFDINVGPNSRTIRRAFVDGVRHHGVPRGVYVDNGRDYKVKDLYGGPMKNVRVEWEGTADRQELEHSLKSQLDLKVNFAIPKNAKAKTIERAFRTVAEAFSKFFEPATYCGSNPQVKPERHAEAVRRLEESGELPTLEILQEAFTHWLEKSYHAWPHTGQGMDKRTPAAVFTAELGDELRVVPEHILAVLAMPAHGPVRVTTHGIVRWANVKYSNTAELLRGWVGKDVVLRASLDDDASVHVYDLKGKFIGTAAQIQGVHPLEAKPEEIRNTIRGQHRAPAKAQPKPESRAESAAKRRAAGELTKRPKAPKTAVTTMVQPSVDSPEAVQAEKTRIAELSKVLELRARAAEPARPVVDTREWLRKLGRAEMERSKTP